MQVHGVIHAHSTYSYDGKLSLPDLKELLFKHGISFCCVTEHTDELTPEQAQAFVEECHKLSDQAFVFVPGFEVPYRDTHVLHIGTSVFLAQIADEATLRKWREVTPWVVLAHPVRNQFVIDDVLNSVIDGVEVWNQQYEGKWAPRLRSLRFYAELKKNKPELKATGGLDLHRTEHFGTPQIELELDTLTVPEIVRQLTLGFYTIKGPSVVMDAHGTFSVGGGLGTKLKSLSAIGIIRVGKALNKGLAGLGLKLPRFVRTWV